MPGAAKRDGVHLTERQQKLKSGKEVTKNESNKKREEVSEEQSVMDDLQVYYNYKNSLTEGASADTDTELSGVDEDSDASDNNYESNSDTGESSGDEDEQRKGSGGHRKNSGARNTKSSKSRTNCPPAPPLLNRGFKKNRFRVENDIEEPGASRSLVQLLRTRTSLNPALPGALEQLNSSTPAFKVLGKTFDYVKRRVAMENWAVALKSQIEKEPETVLRDHFRQVFVTKLRKQMKKEWLYWAEVGKDSGTKSEFYSCWKTMLRKFVSQHPVWMKHQDEFGFNELLEDAGYRCLLTYDKLISRNNKIIQQIKTWRSNIEESMEEKLVFMKKFRALEMEIENKDKKLDEFCHWGKKQLQLSFKAPYFKMSSMDYTNLVSPKNFVTAMNGDALLTHKKQKWTTKDTQALKKIILEVIVDKEYAELMERYNYLASRITYDRTCRNESNEENHRENGQSGLDTEQSVYDQSGRLKPNRRINLKKRSGSDLSTTTIQRVIPVEKEGLVVKALYTVRGTELQQWFQDQESAFRRLNFEIVMKNERLISHIDWFKVAERITLETGKNRCSIGCRLVWLHDAHPDVSNKRWSAASSKKLMELGKIGGKTLSWQEIANEIAGKTPYQCFFKYRNRVVQTEIMKWDDEKDLRVNDALFKEGPRWGKAVEATLDPRATKNQVQERWKKCINPILRNGAFTRVEDALLLLSIERLRGFLQKEGHFGIFMAYLPWRFETVWRDRANNLFSNWIVPWTIEEDQKLLELVESQKERKNWTEISERFTSFKNRKGCLTRYKILRSKIGPETGQFKTLEEYHEAYSMTRYNIFQYRHLREVVDLLKRIEEIQSPGPFQGLSKDRPPSELELRWLLLDYDKVVIKTAIENLEKYINTRDTYWKEWTETNGERKKTFDRRTFHRHDPRSVASAVHIRGLKLVPKDKLDGRELNSFESEVYFQYARFRRTKALKINAKRLYLPSAKKLQKLPEIKRIIIAPPCNAEDTGSGSDWDEEHEFKVRKRGRPKGTAATQVRERGRPKGTAATQGRERGLPKQTATNLSASCQPERKSARHSVRKRYFPEDTDAMFDEEEGTCKQAKRLGDQQEVIKAKVTSESRILKRKRGRSRKSNQESAGVSDAEATSIKRKRVSSLKGINDDNAIHRKHGCKDKVALSKFESEGSKLLSLEEISKCPSGETTSNQLIPKVKRGRPAKFAASQQLSPNISTFPATSELVLPNPKRRGRPPKSEAPLQLSLNTSTFSETSDLVLPNPKRRGRPPKSEAPLQLSLNTSTFSATSDLVLPNPKRRGRPPKSEAPLQLSLHTSTFPATSDLVLPNPKRRGRPPKSEAPLKLSLSTSTFPATSDLVLPNSKRRGRPPKSEAPLQLSLSTSTFPATSDLVLPNSKRRGRPPKSEAPLQLSLSTSTFPATSDLVLPNRGKTAGLLGETLTTPLYSQGGTSKIFVPPTFILDKK